MQFSAYLPFKAELTGADVSQLGFDFLDALPELYPLLDDRRMYMKTSNMDLPPEALASITHLWN